MPRPGQLKSPPGGRASDRIAIGVLTRTFPPELVDEVIAVTGRVQQRHRLLPARVVVYFVLAMCLFAREGYEEVARLLAQGLPGTWQIPSTAAIWRARARLGAQPLKELFARVCRPVAGPQTVGSFYRRWRLVALDGTTFDLPDTPANVQAYGRPGSGRGEGSGAFPQARLVALAECGTHAIFAAVTGPLAVGETVLAKDLLAHLRPGMLLLADRGFAGYRLWRAALASSADLLWRIKSNAALPVLQALPDGSYRSRLRPWQGDKDRHDDPIAVRVIEYTVGGGPIVYRLVTTILDPNQAPAAELAAVYAQRWEFESTLDELKTHQGGPGLVLRSRYPVGVEQEIYGFLLTHHAIRVLMHQAAQASGHDPDRISFLRTLRVVRRQVTAQAAFSPRQTRPRDPQHTD